MAEITIIERKPTLSEYLDLADSVGWSRYVTPETASTALANSLFAVVAEQAGNPVGMGRIVGGGALFLYIQDVVAKPSHQGHGLGDSVMTHLMKWLDSSAPDRAFVGLFSASGKARFYERYGFTAAGPDRPGMYRYLRLPA